MTLSRAPLLLDGLCTKAPAVHDFDSARYASCTSLTKTPHRAISFVRDCPSVTLVTEATKTWQGDADDHDILTGVIDAVIFFHRKSGRPVRKSAKCELRGRRW